MRTFASIAMAIFLASAASADAAEQTSPPLGQAAQRLAATSAPIVAALESAPAALPPPSSPPAAPVAPPPIVSEIPAVVRALVASAAPSTGASAGGASGDESGGQPGRPESPVAAAPETEVVRPDPLPIAGDPAGAEPHGSGRLEGAGRSRLAAPTRGREDSTLHLLSRDAGAARAALGGDGASPAAPARGDAGGSARILDPSPIARLLGSDPPLPIAVFYAALIAALGAIWLSSRRELGLHMDWNRWRG